jgi:1,4-alpha-glucan branching enzyme
VSGPAPGEVAFVLHTHLPYLRGHGVWPVGEEWLFQAWGESWLPVTRMLLRLADDGHHDVLTLGVTPLVAHQVADPRLRADVGTWLGSQMWRAEEQRSLHGWAGPGVAELGSFYWRRYAGLLAFHEQVEAQGGLLAVWADLAGRGVVELLGGPATHPYLPLQADPGLVGAQLACGLDHHASWAGSRPTGIWAPECGYRPHGPVADPTVPPVSVDPHGTPTLRRRGPELPGLEDFYARAGVDHFLVDAATLVQATGGADRDWTTRPAVPHAGSGDPYEVVHDGVLVGDRDVVAFARDLSVAYHVWSPTAGYPGDPWFRDYFARGDFGLHPSWRVTDKALGPMEKAVYEPERAGGRVRHHVDHLHGVLREVLDPRPGDLVVAAYDTELFGHWWFEGVEWLEGILRAVAADPRLTTTTLASRLSRRPPTRRLHLPESSWGYAKGHASWVTPETRDLWAGLRRAEARTTAALAAGLGPAAARGQAARELALLSASDWPFMVTRGNTPGYARERFAGHLDRLSRLCDGIERDDRSPAFAAEVAAWRARDDAPADPSAFLHGARLPAGSTP